MFNDDNSTTKPRKGPEFMALRFNIIQKRKELRKVLSYREYCLLEEIIDGTVDKWESKSKFDLRKLGENLGIRINKTYVTLKSLTSKKIIIREKTEFKLQETIGLNPDIFGQILIDHQHMLELKKHLSLVVDNSERLVPKEDQRTPEKGLDESRKRTYLVPNRDAYPHQTIEIINEKSPIDLIDTYKSLQMEKAGQNLTDEEKKKIMEKCRTVLLKH
jgi:hypothetical protein